MGNLLTNAAKYTPDGGRISLATYAAGGDAVIQVRDNGMGIAPDVLPHVFELFTQADKTLERSQGGLGIGLSVVRKLTEMHGGTVTAHSAGGGRGGRVHRAAAPDRPAGRGRRRTSGRSAPTSGRLRILVVEDNRDTAQVEALLLKSAGHEVQIAYDGHSALDAARQFRPHAMLVDIGLPGLNGYEVAQRIRQEGYAGPQVNRCLRLWTGGRQATLSLRRIRSPPGEARRERVALGTATGNSCGSGLHGSRLGGLNKRRARKTHGCLTPSAHAGVRQGRFPWDSRYDAK
jgi:hypothetical protein